MRATVEEEDQHCHPLYEAFLSATVRGVFSEQLASLLPLESHCPLDLPLDRLPGAVVQQFYRILIVNSFQYIRPSLHGTYCSWRFSMSKIRRTDAPRFAVSKTRECGLFLRGRENPVLLLESWPFSVSTPIPIGQHSLAELKLWFAMIYFLVLPSHPRKTAWEAHETKARREFLLFLSLGLERSFATGHLCGLSLQFFVTANKAENIHDPTSQRFYDEKQI